MPSETTEPTQEQRKIAKTAAVRLEREMASVPHEQRCNHDWVARVEAGIAAALAAEAAPLREEIERLGRENAQCRDLAEGWRKSHGLQYRRAHAADAKVLSLEAEIERLTKERDEAMADAAYSGGALIKEHARADAAAENRDHFQAEAAKLGHDACALTAEIERLKRDFAKTQAWFLAGELNVRDLQKKLAEARKASEASRLLAADKQEELNDAIKERDAASSRAREEQERLGALRAALVEKMPAPWSRDPSFSHPGYEVIRDARENAILTTNEPLMADLFMALAPPAAESQENQQQLTGKGQ